MPEIESKANTKNISIELIEKQYFLWTSKI